MSTAVSWLRRDLRLDDHPALAKACDVAERVLPVFVFDTQILRNLSNQADYRVSFIYRSLLELDSRLKQLGSKLHVLYGDPVQVIPRFADKVGASVVVTARDYEPYAFTRDAAVAAELETAGKSMVTVKDHVILEAGEVLSASGSPFRVYTPFARAWQEKFDSGLLRPYTFEPDVLARTEGNDLGNLTDYGFQSAEPWLAPGEVAAQQRLTEFRRRIQDYAIERDIPSADATSHLSVDLRFGTISVRRAFAMALENSSNGAAKWYSELVWREFYSHILVHFPHVVTSSFQPQYDSISWPGLPANFDAWKAGQTGYPLVDAAMRHFAATGWMHNRLRMVVASFLVKDLLLDWRLGESYFAERLLDFELASNNGGWQWAASTGCDPQPYFRIFNPVLQSRKFDPDGAYIREHCPELRGYDNLQIHWPHDASEFDQIAAGCRLGSDYPSPIIDHSVQRQIAVRLFEDARRVGNGA